MTGNSTVLLTGLLMIAAFASGSGHEPRQAATTGCGFDRDPQAGLPKNIRAQLGALQEATPCSVRTLPAPVREALARSFKETPLSMADPAEKWNSGCVIEDGQARQQLQFAGHSGDTWLVHFRRGGIALRHLTMVLTVDASEARIDWSGSCYRQGNTTKGAPEAERWECREDR